MIVSTVCVYIYEITEVKTAVHLASLTQTRNTVNVLREKPEGKVSRGGYEPQMVCTASGECALTGLI